ncbi:MAG: hypothetical protein ACI82Q_003041, partial [Nonlabens sp.]
PLESTGVLIGLYDSKDIEYILIIRQ